MSDNMFRWEQDGDGIVTREEATAEADRRFAALDTNRDGNISPDELKAAWEPIPEVVGAATVTGQADAVLRLMARDVRHLEQALERIRRAGPVDRSESILVLSELIDRGHP